MPHQITLIPGDGIGPEVAAATKRIVKATGVHIEWEEMPAGIAAIEAGHDDALPAPTVESVRKNCIALKGPTATPSGGGHVSANVRLRKELDLYASIRPVKSIKGVSTRYEDVDLVVFRENTEGLYAGLENVVAKDVVVSIKVVTGMASTRIARAAFEFARKEGRKKVTIAHKANIIKKGDGLFLKCAYDVAAEYPEIEFTESIIDACAMRLVSNPLDFDVLLMENLYGDILSDLCSGLVGGLGLVPGANIGLDAAVFEAVHGTAPDIAGKGLANPTALTMSAVLMLKHIGEVSASEKLRQAILNVFMNTDVRTGDLGGNATTEQFSDAIIKEVEALRTF
ncbi:MAG: isocitrate/isopropylmalate dehydrogenase family protein [Deltaproteobacteria bacterium]|nr:isocitrate/isopropylmalate dehydrogenase family protein [Deltaproteobacteria bacterium]